MVVVQYKLFHFFIGLQCPVKPKRFIQLSPSHHTEIMHHIPAADDQHALFAEWFQLSRQFIVVLRTLVIVQAQLNDRNVGLRIRSEESGLGEEGVSTVRFRWW